MALAAPNSPSPSWMRGKPEVSVVRLMEHALAWAADRDIETLSATALATNSGLQRLVRGVAPDAMILGRADGLINIVIRVGRDVPSGPGKGAVGPITRRRWRAILRA